MESSNRVPGGPQIRWVTDPSPLDPKENPVGYARRGPALVLAVASLTAAAATGVAATSSAGRTSVTPPVTTPDTPRAPEAITPVGGPRETINVSKGTRVRPLRGNRIALVSKDGTITVLKVGTTLKLADGRTVKIRVIGGRVRAVVIEGSVRTVDGKKRSVRAVDVIEGHR